MRAIPYNPKRDVLYLENFPVENAGYQYRANKWRELIVKDGYNVNILTVNRHTSEYDHDRLNLTYVFIRNIIVRFFHCLKAMNYKTVIVRRELLLFNDYGNLFMDKLLLKVHPNAILDFDDDIAASKQEPRSVNTIFGKLMLENGNKFTESLRLYRKFIVASEYLKQKVLDVNKKITTDDVLVIPTCVDYNKYEPKKYPEKIEKLNFGWIGGDYNYYLLDTLLPVLNKLAEFYEFNLIVVGGNPYLRKTDFDIEFIPWSIETEVESLYKIDVGLMPLVDDEVSRGKGGFKLIQYMGLGIVSVASAITINCEIVDHGVDSFLIKNDYEWEEIFISLLENQIDFVEIGKMARKKIEDGYTFDANKEKYLKFLKECVE